MNEKKQINEEYINYKIKSKLSKVIFFDKEIRKKTDKNKEIWKRWDFVINEFIFLRTMQSIKEHETYNGYHKISEKDFNKFHIFIQNNITNYVLKKNIGMTLDVSRVLKIMTYLINNKFTIIKLSGSDEVFETENAIRYRELEIPLDERLRYLLKLGGKYNFMIMILRYLGLGINGHHCAIPINVYEYFYNEFNIRVEGYASPLNSKLLKWQDTNYCSLFGDIDRKFRSIGPFNWKKIVKHQDKNFTVNPPYIESIMDVMYKNVLKAFSLITRHDFMLIILIPQWEDNEVYSKLKTNHSGLVVYTYEPLEGEHYMDCNGQVNKMRGVRNCMFFLSKSKNLNLESKIDKLKLIWNTYVESDSRNQSAFTRPNIIS
jgi:hypothetical protein